MILPTSEDVGRLVRDRKHAREGFVAGFDEGVVFVRFGICDPPVPTIPDVLDWSDSRGDW